MFLGLLLVGGMGVLFYQFESGKEELRQLSDTSYADPWPVLSNEERQKLKEEINDGRCSHWGEANVLGYLPVDPLPEASGLALLDQRMPFSTILLHLNDGAKRPYVVLTTVEGKFPRLVFLDQMQLIDGEDLGQGPCYLPGETEEEQCLFLADVGDNHLQRKEVRIFVFFLKQLANASHSLVPHRSLKITYPPGEFHNVEAMSVHPGSGDIFLLTKESSNVERGIEKRKIPPATLFRLQRRIWEDGDTLVAEKVAQIFLEEMVDEEKSRAKLVTSMDIAPDGKSFVLLTYHHAYEILLDLSKEEHLQLLKGIPLPKDHWRKIKLKKLPQQEAIAFRVSSSTTGAVKRPWSLIYTSEYRGDKVPIMEVPCLYE